MRDEPEPRCPRTDAVLAIYLDGDVGGSFAPTGHDPEESGFDFVCMDSLHEHVAACARCQHQLQRARRLDAALAAGAGRTNAGTAEMAALEQRWFQAITTPPEPVPVDAAAGRSPWLPSGLPRAGLTRAGLTTVLPAAIVAIAAGLFAWLLLAQPRSIAAPVPALETAPSVPLPAPVPAAPEPTDRGAILIAADAARRATERERSAALATQRTPTPAELRQRCTADDTAPRDRLAAAHDLLTLAREPLTDKDDAAEELTQALVGIADHTEGSHLLVADLYSLARGEGRYVAHLQRRLARIEARRPANGNALQTADAFPLPELAALTVATRLGSRALDAALLRTLRRHPDLIEPIAAALRCGLRPNGGAALLLDAWSELQARGALASECAGQFWFAHQPAPLFDELVREVQASGAAPRRVHCLLALGFCPDARAIPLLLAWMRRAPHLEAHAAAFALARQPRQHLQPLLDRATQDGSAFLLRAALARAALPATANWAAAVALGPDERTRLRIGPFREFAQVAVWFRDLPLAVSD